MLMGTQLLLVLRIWRSILYTSEMTQIVNALSLHLSLQELSKKRIMVLGTDRVEESLMGNIGATSSSCMLSGQFI